MAQIQSAFPNAVNDFRASWKNLFITDIVYKIIAFVILTTAVSIAFRIMLSISGRTVLADEDILYFLLEPVGWICLIVVGALWLGIFALEQAALMGILYAKARQHQMSYIGALQFALVWSRPVLLLTARIIVLVLLAVTPFLVVAGVVYFSLLTQFDINYYLAERPPAFLFALALGAIIIIAIVIILLHRTIRGLETVHNRQWNRLNTVSITLQI